MAKVKVVNNNLDQNLNGNNFTNIPSQTIFSFGNFAVTSNFDSRTPIDYTNTLSSFVRAVTLDTMGVDDVQSQILHEYATNVVLNLDKSDLNTFIRFGSAYEYLRVCVENIVNYYPYSLFVSSQVSVNNNVTFLDYAYDAYLNTSTFKIPINAIINPAGLTYNTGNSSKPNDMALRNLNLSYDKYVIWTSLNPNINNCNVIGYTGNTSGRNYLTIKTIGNPFSGITTTSSPVDFHIKPNNFMFEEFRALLNPYEKYILSTRDGLNGFKFEIKDPILLDDGNITYSDSLLIWSTGDGYNLDTSGSNYQKFIEILLTIGAKYDKIKTDLIARFLTPNSLKVYDLTEHGKMTKLLRIYGREFDQIREFIDSLVYINKVSYDKINNIPDQLIKNLSRTFGWNYFSLVNENELVQSFLTIDDNERDLNHDLLPAEIDVELWRRILMNTSYFWKTKGTREAIKSMFLLIGIPEPFVNITEYVYTVDGRINPNTVGLTATDFQSQSLPYDTDGYPKAPVEIKDFYFQISGNTDSGQAYMNNFRKAGFDLNRTIDNKKSWVQSGATYRIDDTTPQYYQRDSRLVLNTKEVDVALDTARGIEYDVYEYIQTDFTVNSSGYTLPYSYVNISLDYANNAYVFPLPSDYSPDKVQGDLEVRFNGILLNAPDLNHSTGTLVGSDYTIDYGTKTFTLLNGISAHTHTNGRDVIQATFIYSGGTHSMSGISVSYIVTRVDANISGTEIILPTFPRGDVQVTINGISLTKGTPQFAADYIVDPNNSISGISKIIIQNQEVIAYLQENPQIQVAYVEVQGSNDIYARSEIVRVDSFNSNKIYFNQSANKFVYKLNYKANKASDIKVLVDGIALEPNNDYSINVQNLYEVFLPRGIKYGTIISVYYLVGGNAVFHPVVNDIFGVGDISRLSFLEFMELIQRKMINARNRKTISDFKGGWYPSLLRLYTEYLKRSVLPDDDPLQSNGYTFQNLYSFLSKYNAFFQRFVDQLLSATIILRRSGLMVRNSIFTKQKFMYRRGVNLYAVGSTTIDRRNDYMVEYLGDDGSVFMINQYVEPPAPEPELYVNTIQAIFLGSTINLITGGNQIINYDILTSYGIQYRWYDPNQSIIQPPDVDNPVLGTWTPWITLDLTGSLPVNNFSMIISDTEYNTTYQYRAYVHSGIYGYTGQTLQTVIPAAPQVPEIHTKQGTAGTYSINNTGGRNIIGWADADYYAMQYTNVGPVTSNISVTPSTLNYLASGGTKDVKVSGDSWNTTTIVKAPALTWITAPTSVAPSLTGGGTSVSISVANNSTTSTKTGVLCFVPSVGTTKCVTINQAAAACTAKQVYMAWCDYNGDGVATEAVAWDRILTNPAIAAGECYSTVLNWNIMREASPDAIVDHCVVVKCNNTTVYTKASAGKIAVNCSGSFAPLLVKYGDCIDVCATVQSMCGTYAKSSATISSVTNGVGSFMVGSTPPYNNITVLAETLPL